MGIVRPHLWFAQGAEKAAEFYAFGVSWQVVPRQLDQIFGDYTSEGSKRALGAMFTMSKLDIAALEAAARS